MHKVKNWPLLSKCSIIIFLCLMCMSTTAKADMVTFNLDNVYVYVDSASQKMTGSFEWTYDAGDFENGNGIFTNLYIPVHGTEIINLNITIEPKQIEFSLAGNYHDRDVGIMLDLIGQFSPSQSAAINASTSKFNVQKSGRDHIGTFESGSIIIKTPPIPDISANGSDGPLILTQGDNLNVTLAIDPGSHLGVNTDWWIFIISYDPDTGSLTPIVTTGFQSPLINMPPTTIVNTTSFPTGTFLFFFGVDMVPDATFDEDQLYSDIVPVIIQ